MTHNKLKFTSGGGCMMLFGLPFLLAGLAVIGAGLSGNMKMDSGGPASPFFYLPFGGIFASVGAGIMFGRAGTTLDDNRRVLFTWWGLLFPFKKTEYHWDDYDWVRVNQKIVRTDKSTRITFPVELVGPQATEVTVHTLSSALEGRRVAEQVAKYMNLGVKDVSRGTEIVREAGTLDETVRDRILRLNQDLELTAAPTGAKSRLDISGNGASFDIPAPGFGIIHYLGGAFALFIGLFMSAFFGIPAMGMLKQGGETKAMAVIWVLIGFGVLASFVSPLVQTLVQALASRKLTIDKENLTLVTTHSFGSSTKVIPLSELEELDLRGLGGRLSRGMGGGQQIQAVSDRADMSFGGGLDNEELAWMKNTLEYMISKA